MPFLEDLKFAKKCAWDTPSYSWTIFLYFGHKNWYLSLWDNHFTENDLRTQDQSNLMRSTSIWQAICHFKIFYRQHKVTCIDVKWKKLKITNNASFCNSQSPTNHSVSAKWFGDVWCPQFGYIPAKEFVPTPALPLLLRVINAYFTTALLKQGAPRLRTNEHTSPSNKNNKPTCGIEPMPYKMGCPFQSL